MPNVLPKSWSRQRLSWLFEVISSGTTPPTEDDEFYNGEIPWVTTGELRESTIHSTSKNVTCHALARHSALQLYPIGALVIAMYGATIGRLGILGTPATTNQACCVLAGPRGVIPKFVFYVLMSARGHIAQLASGGGQPNINQDKVRALRIGVPPLGVQARIVQYLDRETAQIDELIAKQGRLIELLSEKRRAVLTRTVTKGLDPTTPTKPSGIPWLGEVAAHWTVVDLKHVVQVLTGFPFRSEDFSQAFEDVALLRGININPGKTNWSETVRIPQRQAKEYAEYSLKLGDLVLGLDRPIVSDGIRVCAIGREDLPAILLQRVARIRSNGLIEQDYVAHLLSSPVFSNYLEPLFTGVSVPHMSPSQLGEFKIALPPSDEQKSASNHLRVTLNRLDVLANKAADVISLLRERRSALISAAVTGGIDCAE